MLELLKRCNMGMEMFTVLYSIGDTGEMIAKDFWSEEHARAFIGRKFHWINLSSVKVNDTTKIKG